ncbi:DUF4422 domain-containing protein [Clostridium sp. CAG:265]|uniref:DUF4422 domain-containing protein n=1 Tax=Clostridium sp. CAG:265 TaxID=1262787 RepID=UPI00033E249F|nr:DUF4422 domain-containing protein [Clostridium sp. CAG:265]CDB75849.1 galactosyl transferase [Clostridium sp. CAG:265]
MKDCTFFIVTHKSFNQPNIENYHPIIVGNNNLNLKEAYYDNNDDNISFKNKNYCELTAMYWIWRNYHNSDYVGICHYRRFFIKNRFVKNESGYLTSDKAKKILKKYDIILPTPWVSENKSVKEWYLSTDGKSKDLDELRNVIYELYPEYVEEYDYVMNGNIASYLNMLVTTKSLFDEYCKWLFDILFELEKRIDISSYTPLEARVFGFLSERLLNVWVRHKSLRIKWLQVYQTEKPFSQKKMLKEDIKRILIELKKKRGIN